VAGYEWQRSQKDHCGGEEKSLTRPHLAENGTVGEDTGWRRKDGGRRGALWVSDG
jgi:hypothetical protein